ncbi:tetratricopeptide repeat-containing sensor histidine kinase [Spongiimicrobium salis]|uniref:tetratricopeptide repeat-containing sensor histidine kinase n=1 Tax=Spongiimicrobium salis TaxID=1667022 RepID=UPI00374C94DA
MNKLRIFILLMVVSQTLHSQFNDITQLDIDLFAKDSISHRNPNHRKNLSYMKTMLDSNRKLYGRAEYMTKLATSYFVNNQLDSAVFYYNRAIDHHANLSLKYHLDDKSMKEAHYMLSRITHKRKNYEKALKHGNTALFYEKKYPDIKWKPYLLTLVARCNHSLGSYRKASELFLKVAEDSAYMSSARNRSAVTLRLGIIYSKNYLNVTDSSLYYLKKEIKSALRPKGFRNNLPFAYAYLGSFFKERNRDSAMAYYKKSLQEFELNRHTFGGPYEPTTNEISILVIQAYVSLQEGNYTETIHSAETAIGFLNSEAQNSDERDMILDAYSYLLEAYEKLGDYEQANKHLRIRETILKDFHKKELQSKIENLTVEYETREKVETIQRLETEKSNMDLAYAKKRAQLYLSIIVAIVVVLFLFGAFKWRNLKGRLQKVSLEQRLLLSQLNPHFIFNVLQNVISMIDNRPQQAQKLTSALGKLLRMNLENSREDFVDIRDEIKALNYYMEIYQQTVVPFSFKIILPEDLDSESNRIPPMMVQPLVENAIKHGVSSLKEQGNIIVEFSKGGNGHLACAVKDNGPGFAGNNSNHRSLGLQILLERAQKYFKRKSPDFLRFIDKKNNKEGYNVVLLQLPMLND